MSQPGSSKPDGEGTLLTIMLVVAAIFMIAGTIIVSTPLKEWYDKFLWNFN